jgi:ribonuclease D
VTLPTAGEVPYRLIDTAERWQGARRTLAGAARIGLDLEADGFHRYPERVALIQIAAEGSDCLLLDVLVLDELELLGEVLANPAVRKVFHAADYDVRALHRDFGFEVHGLADTAIAAQFTGAERTGLANVVAARLGVTLDKPKRLQRLDWSRRPIPADALDYAAADAAFLLPLFDDLHAELVSLGRDSWVAEEWQRMEDVRFLEPDPPERAFLHVPGARDLSNKGRAVLKELCLERESIALATGRPPYRVAANRTLIQMATDAAEDRAVVAERTAPQVRDRLTAAAHRGLAADPVPWPRSRGRDPWDAQSRKRLAALKAWRTAAAAALGLDAGIVWPLGHLKRVALRPDADPRALDDPGAPEVRAWQWRELGEQLEEAVRALRQAEPRGPIQMPLG